MSILILNHLLLMDKDLNLRGQSQGKRMLAKILLVLHHQRHWQMKW
uniref:Uncharacterized protein n=1 Tax=Rhizophora mucronata TaxID=61149 RepID=A0A2P2MN38_RHIMU